MHSCCKLGGACSSADTYAGIIPYSRSLPVLLSVVFAMHSVPVLLSVVFAMHSVPVQDAAADLEAAHEQDPDNAIGAAAHRTARRLVVFIKVSSGSSDLVPQRCIYTVLSSPLQRTLKGHRLLPYHIIEPSGVLQGNLKAQLNLSSAPDTQTHLYAHICSHVDMPKYLILIMLACRLASTAEMHRWTGNCAWRPSAAATTASGVALGTGFGIEVTDKGQKA